MPPVHGRAMFNLTSLPEDVVEMIVSRLNCNDKVGPLPVPARPRKLRSLDLNYRSAFGMQTHLAFSCKALLPILGMGHVKVNLSAPGSPERPLQNATRCLTKQPGGVLHLEMCSYDDLPEHTRLATRHLSNLRCVLAPIWCWCIMVWPLLCCAMGMYTRGWTGANVAVGFCSLLENLRKLTLHNVDVSLPALQPVATRLRELHMVESCLQGSADGFLTKGWTALTSMSLTHSWVEVASLTAPLNLPALEETNIIGFRHQGRALQLDQLTGSCPQLRKLRVMLGNEIAQGREGRGPCCSLQKLGRLADLYLWIRQKSLYASLDLDLPASLTRFEVSGTEGDDWTADFFWVLSEAAKCIRRGAQLRRVTCSYAEACMQPAQWGASLVEQYGRLGGQLSRLRELEVWGGTERLLSALGAVISSAPHLTCVEITITERLPRMELPPICSASLESIIVAVDVEPTDAAPPPQVAPLVLTFLPGCTRLQQVLVRLSKVYLTKYTMAKIRCHSASPTRIKPLLFDEAASQFTTPTVGVQVLPGPPSPQGYTVLHECPAAGPQQPFKWSHVVVPGFL